MGVELIFFREGDEQRVIPLPKAESVIGRSDTADLRIPLPSVSRDHCRVTVKDGAASVVDLGSSNGTFVNGKKIDATTPLRPGDRLGVGAIVFVVRIDGDPAQVEAPLEEGAAPDETGPGDLQTGAGESDADIADLIAKAAGTNNDDSSVFEFDIDLDDDED